MLQCCSKKRIGRLCAKGYEQKSGVDFKEIFSPTVRYDSIRILLAVAAKYKLSLLQCNVKTAILNDILDEEIYKGPPEGVDIFPERCLKLKKLLYGLKQSSRCWNKTFDNFLKLIGFHSSSADKCVYTVQINNDFRRWTHTIR